MPPIPPAPPKRSFDISDAYYILFRHKWKILGCALAGLIAAGCIYKLIKPPYQSVAKLFVRFVVTEGKSVGPNHDDATAKSPDQRGETIMSGEKEILTSMDLCRRVAETLGPEKLLAKEDGPKEVNRAAGVVRSGLSVNVPFRSAVIHVTFQHPDAELVQPVLREVVETYLKMHVEAHRTAGMIGDSLAQETDQLRAKLAQTEEDLRKVRLQAGVVSIDATKQAYSDEMGRIRNQIFAVQSELAAQNAVLAEMNRLNGLAADASAAQPAAPVPPPAQKADAYRATLSRIANLQSMEQGLLAQFTAESPRVKELHQQLVAAEEEKRTLLAEHPALAHTATPGSAAAAGDGLPTSAAQAVKVATDIAASQARLKVLNEQLGTIRAEAEKVDQLEATIRELTRNKELIEENYKYYAASLEQSRIKETLGAGRVSNIAQIQSPSPPFADRSLLMKVVAGVAAGGLVLGLAWAAAIELLLDRTLRRAGQVERALNIPLFLTMPTFKRSRRQKAEASAALAAAAPPQNALAQAGVFHETLRDRMIGYFESKGLTHKPKLVAVTGVSRQAGVTSIAAGLARSLSETGDGNVLLVDLTNAHGSSQHFTHGKPQCDLDDLWEARDSALVESNLYVVREGQNSDQLSRQLPQRFTKIVPKLKASDFDYIIFDMPTVSQVSITPRLANFMDMVLLVVESEKTNQEIAERAVGLLRNSKAHLGVVMNKTKTYIPAALDHELLVSV